MQTDLLPPDRDPLGAMLTDYLAGSKEAFVTVESSTLDMSKMPGATMFRVLEEMSDMEKEGLSLCGGRVLDVGAGSGCHSLVLQDRGVDVTAMDISPGCVAVMEARGVTNVCHDSLFTHEERGYDTLLMLMNGIGLCGTIDGLNYFFQYARDLLAPGGQIIADSTDISGAWAAMPMVGGEEPYYGETRFVMSYKDAPGEPFDWLYIDYATLAFYAEFHGWRCRRIFSGEEGKYLVRIH